MRRRHPPRPASRGRNRLLLLVLALALGALVAACGGGEDEEAVAPPPAPAEETPPPPAAEETAPAEEAPAGCQVKGVDGDTIRVFASADTPSAVIGENIGPAAHGRMSTLWISKTNAEGGILGCQVQFEVKDDSFDIPTCLRNYRDAIASGDYHFFIGPTNSGCMASLSDLTNAAGKSLISGVAADHQPFFEKFTPYVYHASVSTFLEGRASAKFAAENGWKRVALMVPNYAYGQDVGKGFKDYYAQLVPDGTVVNEQFPEFDEDNFTPFITAMVANTPDGILTAFFGPFVVPFAKQWKASGNDQDIPTISGLAVLDTFAGFKQESDIPANFYGYDRGNWLLLQENPVAQEYIELWEQEYGDKYPIPDSFTFQLLSSWQLAKALLEKTQSVEAEDWKAAVEAGDFSFDGPYTPGPTYVNPVNHMADTCASVGKVVWNADLPIPPSYDPESFVVACMHEVLPKEEALELTNNPDVTEEAVDQHYSLAGGS